MTLRELFSKLVRQGRLTRSETAVLVKSSRINDRVDVLLKAIDRLEKQAENHLLTVVDDFTEAIVANPDRKDFRRSRREALKTIHEIQDTEVDVARFRHNLRKLIRKQEVPEHMDHPTFQVDVSKIPRRDTEKVADLGKYMRQ